MVLISCWFDDAEAAAVKRPMAEEGQLSLINCESGRARSTEREGRR